MRYLILFALVLVATPVYAQKSVSEKHKEFCNELQAQILHLMDRAEHKPA
jgi:hypothetical protein